MRWLFRLLCVCALGAMPAVGCNVLEGDCPGGCDDMNPCTYDQCTLFGCGNIPLPDGTGCPSGACVDGVCGPNLCAGVVCDDRLPCTADECDYEDGTCYFQDTCDDNNECTDDTCDDVDGVCDFTPIEDGRFCRPTTSGGWAGMCNAGVCVEACDPASNEVYQCPITNPPWPSHFCCPGKSRCFCTPRCEVQC